MIIIEIETIVLQPNA